MKLRVLVPASMAMITVVAAAACVVAGRFWIASGLVLSAIAIAGLARWKIVYRIDAKALLESLRVAQRTGAVAANAVVTSKIIFIAKSKISDTTSSRYVTLFRDEMDASLWRELATLLRHQTHAQPDLKKVDQVASLRLGKSSDL